MAGRTAPHARLGFALAAVTLTHLGLLLTWSVVVPTFRAPDEHVHHDFVRHLTTTWAYPDYDGLDVSRRTLDALGTSPAFPAHAGAVGEDQAMHRNDRPGWDDLGPDVRNGPPNQMPMHPPLYYEAAGAALRAIDGDGAAPLDRAVWQLRLLNVLIMAPLPLIAAAVARRFSSSTAVGLSAAAGVLAVPQLTHIGASVSNDPLMIVLGSLALLGAAHLATGDRRWGTAAATGLLAGLALFTKGFAMPLVPAIALACLLPLWTGRRGGTTAATAESQPGDASLSSERPASTPGADPAPTSSPEHLRSGRQQTSRWDSLPRQHAPADRSRMDRPAALSANAVVGQSALVAVLALVFGGWWWVRNVIVHGTPQPGVRLRDRVPDVELDVLRFAGDFSERIVTSFWGRFGWFEAHLPFGLSVAMTALVVIAVIAACWGSWSRLVLAIPPLVATAMVLSAGWGAFKKTGVSYATQGRYLFTGIVGVTVLVAIGIARLARGRSRWHTSATVTVALGMQAAGLWICVSRYWAGDSIVDRLRAMAAFAPLPGPVTAGVLAAAAICAVAALVLAFRLGGADRTAHEHR